MKDSTNRVSGGRPEHQPRRTKRPSADELRELHERAERELSSDERAELSARPPDTTTPPAWAHDDDEPCGAGYITGGHDPYGTTCDREPGHYPQTPHEGPHPVDMRPGVRIQWRGGGSVAGDKLPYRDVVTVDEQQSGAKLTETSLALFLAYARDAGNWGGTPLVGGNVCISGEREDRGNLTQLKRAGLVLTFTDDGSTWLSFTDAGRQLAARHGVDLSWTA